MASTNKTTNYDLSQYIGTDKPTYLGDYNSDMQKIDAQMKTNADNVATAISSAQTATSTANQANTTAGQANTTAQTANTTAGQANTTAQNAQSTANSALSTATTASGKADQVASNLNTFEQKFNFTSIKDLTLSVTNGTIGANDIKVATNSEGSIGKVYGRVQFTRTGSNNTFTGTSDLRPSETITINSLGLLFLKSSSSSGSWVIWSNASITITTD
ncbi:MAG: hypothetical protein VZR33_05795, partial [Methanosphaera sp.]|nr:hypothetical protein [Methanosphaera sp.]